MIIENWVIGSRGGSAIFSSESRYGNAVIQYQETLPAQWRAFPAYISMAHEP